MKKLFFYKKILQKTVILAIALFLFHTKLFAEDKRHVQEPIIPKTCKILEANDQDSTNILQQAINVCAKQHQIVHLISHNNKNIFYSGPLNIPSYGGLLIDKTVILKSINDPNLYNINNNQDCGTLNNSGKGCKPFITINGENNGIYGNGYIDGQGGHILKNKNFTWWQLATEAKLKNKKQNAPHLIDINNSKDVVLYKIHLINSPNFHIVSHKTNGLTIWGISINTPADARNTDGIDPSSSQNITITHTNISTGDDNIAIKAGSTGESKNISIINNNFGYGHGMSIGSETQSGVNNILITNLSLINTTNGLRIKSDSTKGGLVNNIYYKNICMFNVKNPIVLDAFYKIVKINGEHIPQFNNIYFENISVLTPGQFVFNGFDVNHIIQVFFKNIHIHPGSIWTKHNVHINGSINYDTNADHCPNM
ncbi:glycoside hydrolase family 28 protein [Enterobacteriaceae endosymbiont of Neohaemonia nigricornis]|uniref:glycoside hydrolase family 28 protein n=1 Tax=Enterobacteriaceae endosymbiont of Neohaemonia nigricornis TaxID=2675792 RepID=UPI0014499193|nr:glycosyl hydrolase family 28 protein [Enterobacteriaceae endosymbiont of Neohaemonia nigricornis]QJC30636.1 endopolygalacturonase [Enterobacteriaceae endosymbiont of Neohaemonia nigricornis]